MEVTVSTSQVIAVLSAAASPTAPAATTLLAGVSLGRRRREGRGEAGEVREKGWQQSWGRGTRWRGSILGGGRRPSPVMRRVLGSRMLPLPAWPEHPSVSIAQTENPKWKKVTSFFSLSKKGFLKETTNCKLSSLLLLFLDGYKDSVVGFTPTLAFLVEGSAWVQRQGWWVWLVFFFLFFFFLKKKEVDWGGVG